MDSSSVATVAAAFRRQARATPAAIAVRTRRSGLSYRDLDRAVEACAARLRGRGAGPGRLVGLLLPRSIEAIVAILGTLRAGAGFVPLDADYPAAALAAMSRDCDPAVLIADPALLAQTGGADAWRCPTMLGTEVLGPAPAGAEIALNDEHVAGRNDPAYVMYTSGSTGAPKGVVVPQRAVLRLVQAPDYARLGADDVILQLAPLGFDACIFEIFGALLNGGTLAIETEPQPSLDAIAAAIEAFGVTTLWLTAGLFHLMVDHHLPALARLRQLLAGGDVLSPSHVRRMLHGAPGCRLINGYGPTENTTFTCCYPIPQGWDGGDAGVPIGWPINGTVLHILDANGQSVADGVAGELCAAGDGVALGYLNRPELTAERFMPDPDRGAGALIYRTGDRVRRRTTDGVIEFLGRIDRQIKVNGKRIEPDGIEAALRGHRGVRDAMVFVELAERGGRIVAGVAGDPGTLSERELAAHLAVSLPSWMMPSRIVVMERLPLTPNGKRDRAALRPLADVPDATSAAATQAPATPACIDDGLRGIWAGVLNRPVSAVDARANFFDLGGSSLQMLALQERVRRELGRPLPIVDFFAHPTLAALAAHLDATQDGRQIRTSAFPGVQARAAMRAAALRRSAPR